MKPPAIWTLSFIAKGDGPPIEIRVRRLLKSAIRTFGLKCVDYRIGINSGESEMIKATETLESNKTSPEIESQPVRAIVDDDIEIF